MDQWFVRANYPMTPMWALKKTSLTCLWDARGVDLKTRGQLSLLLSKGLIQQMIHCLNAEFLEHSSHFQLCGPLKSLSLSLKLFQPTTYQWPSIPWSASSINFPWSIALMCKKFFFDPMHITNLRLHSKIQRMNIAMKRISVQMDLIFFT